MRAHLVENYCDHPDFILKQDFPVPPLLSDTQLLVHLKAFSLNPADYKTRNGCAKLLFPLRFPAVLGKDGSGQVVATGSKVLKFKPGDSIVGCQSGNRSGTFAEFAVFEESECTLKPKELSHVQASAFPTAGLTMIEAFRTHPEMAPIIERESQKLLNDDRNQFNDDDYQHKPNEEQEREDDDQHKPKLNIMIIGASGGIGCMSLMFVKNFLSRFFRVNKLIAVCSGKNERVVSELGANVVIDYMKTSARHGPQTIHDEGEVNDDENSRLPSVCQLLRKEHGVEFVDFVLDCYGGYYYYDDVCSHLSNSNVVTSNGSVKRTFFTTVNPPGIDSLNFTNLLKMAYLMLSTKMKSWLSYSYPVFQLASFEATNERYFKLLLEQVAIASCDAKNMEQTIMVENLPLTVYSFDEIKEAHVVLESKRAVGKLVIDMEKE